LWTNSIGAGGTHRNRRAVTSANAMTSEVTGCWRHAASRSVFDAIAPGCYVNCGGRIRHIREKTAGNSSQPALRLEETKKTKAGETEDDEGQEDGDDEGRGDEGRRRQRMSKRSNEENEGQRREVRRQVRRQGQRKQRVFVRARYSRSFVRRIRVHRWCGRKQRGSIIAVRDPSRACRLRADALVFRQRPNFNQTS
jgi:hypothetical protein